MESSAAAIAAAASRSEPARKDRRRVEHHPVVGSEQVVGPGDRPLKCPVPGGDAVATTTQQTEPGVEAVGEVTEAHRTDPRRSQLQRQRQTVEATADLARNTRL
jgi:hypothetical protein